MRSEDYDFTKIIRCSTYSSPSCIYFSAHMTVLLEPNSILKSCVRNSQTQVLFMQSKIESSQFLEGFSTYQKTKLYREHTSTKDYLLADSRYIRFNVVECFQISYHTLHQHFIIIHQHRRHKREHAFTHFIQQSTPFVARGFHFPHNLKNAAPLVNLLSVS